MESELKMTPFNSHISFKNAVFSLLELSDSRHLSVNSFFHIFHTSLQEKRLPTQQRTHMKTSCLKKSYCLWRALKNIKVQIVPASIENTKFTFLVIPVASCECCLSVLPNTQPKVAAKSQHLHTSELIVGKDDYYWVLPLSDKYPSYTSNSAQVM